MHACMYVHTYTRAHTHTHTHTHTEEYTYNISYRIRGNFRGSYISWITCQEDFCILIFADDLTLNDYTALDYCLRNFQGLKVHGWKLNSKNCEFYVPRKLPCIRYIITDLNKPSCLAWSKASHKLYTRQQVRMLYG